MQFGVSCGYINDIGFVTELQSLERQGLDGIVFSLPNDLTFRLTGDFARQVIAKMRPNEQKEPHP